MQQAKFKFHIAETVYIVHRTDQLGEVKKILSLLFMVYKNHNILRYCALSNFCLSVTTSIEIDSGLEIISLM